MVRRAAVLSSLLAAACGGGGTGPSTDGGAGAAGQWSSPTAPAGSELAAVPAIRVTDGGGRPVAGVGVSFTVTEGGGSVERASDVTDGDGIATSGAWTLGTTPGRNTLTARASGVPGSPVVFTATGVTGPAGKAVPLAGNAQPAKAGEPVAILPAVLVTDVWDNPVPGVAVSFAVSAGGGSITGAAQTTGADGVARVGSWTLGPSVGFNTLIATVAGAGVDGNPVTFGVDAKPSAPGSLVILGQPASTARSGVGLSPPPVVALVDATNTPVREANVTITATLVSGTGTIQNAVGTTNGDGIAGFPDLSIRGVAGPYRIGFAATGYANATSDVVALSAGPAASFAIAAGDGQTAPAGTAVPVAPTVRLLDAEGNPVQGTVVRFMVARGGGEVAGWETATDADGYAAVGSWTLGAAPGANELVVSAPGAFLPDVTFTATGS